MKKATMIFLSGVLALGLFAGCSEDPRPPREPNGVGPSPHGGVGGNSGDQEPDVADGEDVEEDVEPEICLRTPREGTDFERPCCFSDADCHASDAQNAASLRCYGARCSAGGEGICLPYMGNGSDCWGDEDCAEDQVCQSAMIGTCDEPMSGSDTAGICR